MSTLTIVCVAGGFAIMAAAFVMIFRLRNVPQPPAVPLAWNSTPIWFRILWLVTLINFFAFLFADFSLGGDASNGYHSGHQYFLGAKGGSYIPVSRNVWLYSHYHGLSVWVLFFTAIVALGWYTTRAGSPKA